MSRVASKNTTPELRVRRALHAAGFRFRIHSKTLAGSPDIVLPRYRLAIFVHGCFWHRHSECPKAKLPKSRVSFWRKKLEANKARDELAREALVALGWRVLVVWECNTKSQEDLAAMVRCVQTEICAKDG